MIWSLSRRHLTQTYLRPLHVEGEHATSSLRPPSPPASRLSIHLGDRRSDPLPPNFSDCPARACAPS
ncbi:hypothetical protein BV20DRAFT_965812 [Pilatotrama ljubarskyi]|nr:hypothetical protein BV20DRAFT_976123 [Pilatotrama ljubarskyi]KAI0371140.1 hypothetical protein BV20DRAFT_965812 [Pilatotrama ljubarskyi]